MNRPEKAVEYKHCGNNCCQAVLLAFEDKLDIPADALKKTGAGFGCGMGAFDATCGALCGAEMILGMKKYSGKPILKDAKALHGEFKNICGSTDCGELKGLKGGKMLCDCDNCVRNAVKLAERSIESDVLT